MIQTSAELLVNLVINNMKLILPHQGKEVE